MTSTTRELLRRLRPFQRRLRLRDVLGWAQRSAWFPGSAFVVIQAIGRLVPIPNLLLWSFVPLLAWVVALLGYWALHRLPPPSAARRADLLLDLRERMSTALELSRKAELDELERQQQADALATALRVQPKQIGWAFERRSLATFAVPLLLGLALLFVPNPQDRVLADQAAIRQAVRQTVAQIDEQAETLRQDQELSQAERERLLQELEQLKRELQASPTRREEALAKLSTTEARLREGLDPQADARRAGLEQLARRLQQERGQQARGAQPSDAAAELQQLAQELANLSQAEQQQLADALSQQAQELANTESELARALQQAADALRNGDAQTAGQQLQQAGQQASAADQRLTDNAATEQTLSQLQQSRQSIAQAGQNQQQAGQQGQPGQQGQQGQQGQGQGQPGQQGQQGQGQNQGQGQGQQGQQGQGQGQNQGQGQGPGGSNANNLGDGQSNADGNVQPNGTGQQQADNAPSRDSVYQPYRPSGQPGEGEQVSGQPGSEGNEQVRPGQYGPGANNGTQVPYEEVYGEYSDAAGEALDRSAIPPHLKGYVRDYFSELAPDN